MILGLSTSAFTAFHVILSLIGVGAGAIVLFGMFRSIRVPGATATFLATTILTTLTGFFFPRDHLLPSHIVGIISLVALAIAIVALYVYHLVGSWRWLYVVASEVALYLNVFVGVVQAFLKVPALNALAPKQSDPPFIIAQIIVMVLFLALGFLAVRSFHPETNRSALGPLDICLGGRSPRTASSLSPPVIKVNRRRSRSGQ